jgi:DNA polymerase III epsilon subunit-like protein
VLSRHLYLAGLLPGQLGSKGTSLKGLAQVLKIEVDEKKMHTAAGDVELTAKVFFKLHSMLKALSTEFGRLLYGENQ